MAGKAKKIGRRKFLERYNGSCAAALEGIIFLTLCLISATICNRRPIDLTGKRASMPYALTFFLQKDIA